MDLAYAITPFLTWLLTGCTKFLVNCIRDRRFAFDLIGYGGMPSNHSAIVSSTTALIGIREGYHHPAFGVALTLAFIVMMDAVSLRRELGKHAVRLNLMESDVELPRLRERQGHSPSEILAGAALGSLIAWLVSIVLSPNGF